MNKGETHIIVLVAAIFFVAALITTHFLLPLDISPLGKATGDPPVSLTPVHDGYINHNRQNDTYEIYGSSSQLWVGNFAYTDGSLSFESRTFLRFDLSGQTDVSNAVLHIAIETGTQTIPTCPKVYKIPDYYADSVFNQNDFTPASQTFVGNAPCNSDISMNIESSFLQLGQPNAFMIVRDLSELSNVNMYSSKETSGTKPSLELFFTGNAPPVPTGLTAVTGGSGGHVNLSWTAPSSDVTNYVINWWTATPGDVIINTGNVTSYDFTTTVSPYASLPVHNFRIKACNGSVCSDYSTAVNAYPKLGQVDAYGPPENPSGPYNVIKDVQFNLDGGMQYVPSTRTVSWSMPNCTPSSSSSLDPVISCSASTTATLTVIAVNGTGTDSVAINVSDQTDIVDPVVSITIPSAGATVSGTINISATASDASGIKDVKFFVDGSLKSTDSSSPYEYSWNTVAESNAGHQIKVVAEDNAGNTAEQIITVTVDNSVLELTAEAGGPYIGIINASIQLTGQAVNAEGSASFLWEELSDSADCTINTPSSQNPAITCGSSGTASLRLTVTADNGSANDTATITVSSQADTTLPTVSISSPSSGQTVTGTANFSANASDASGIKDVKFFVDGSLKSTDSSSPYEYSWVTTTVSNGSHALKVVAEDTAGNTAEATVSVSVNNVSGPLCGNGVIDSGEECEVDSQCYSFYDRTQCDYSGKRYGTRTVTCDSSCSCSVGSWVYSSSSYCSSCNSCGDGTQNCNETEASCPEDFGGITDTVSPVKPTGLEVTKTTKDSITIEWNPNTESDLKRYIIYYEKSPDGTVEEETALKTDSSIVISGLESNSRYFISIVAVDLSGNKSVSSDEVSVITKDDVSVVVPVPTGLNAVVENKSIVLKWSVVVPEPDYYVVQRKVDGDYFEQIGTPENNSFEDSDVEEDTKYFYRVAAFLDGKSSNVSEEIEIEFKPETPEDNSITEWGIGSAIIVISLALGYIFFNFDI